MLYSDKLSIKGKEVLDFLSESPKPEKVEVIFNDVIIEIAYRFLKSETPEKKDKKIYVKKAKVAEFRVFLRHFLVEDSDIPLKKYTKKHYLRAVNLYFAKFNKLETLAYKKRYVRLNIFMRFFESFTLMF
ncbi:hypothetical protein SCHIN_v1c01100 [Spiroplasma chinense]|uniref:Uncharacterized protein n=1 Tax=Spiroplasma chinense TaxID=216932 RepID=A0A5B9Y2P4_9MOLU|nr:hypothetical protein [Spiroplasma chinense]QEH61308.1 hypothetical protein SCHIN_v1c01100 [Spiroplasma chinense]